MPRGDGTGPTGAGPKTGRGAGSCEGPSKNTGSTGFFGRFAGRGGGAGTGRGFGRGFFGRGNSQK